MITKFRNWLADVFESWAKGLRAAPEGGGGPGEEE